MASAAAVPVRVISPETVTPEDLAAMGMTREQFEGAFRTLVQRKALAPFAPESGWPIFGVTFPLKSPCERVANTWFIENRARVIRDANAGFEALRRTRSFDCTYDYFDDKHVRNGLYWQMAMAHIRMAQSRTLAPVVPNGCCPNAATCTIIQYQRQLLASMRAIARGPIDF